MENAQQDIAEAISEAISTFRPAGHRVVTFGEALVRLMPPAQERIERANTLHVSVGGPELATAVGLIPFDFPVSWVTALPDSPMGRRVVREASGNGVDVSAIHWVPASDARVGLAYIEDAPDPRTSTVEHDTRATAFSRLRPGTFDWPRLLEGASLFHVSGVTLGRSPGALAEALEAIRVANQQGTLVSFDLRYAPEAWSESEARSAFTRLIHDVDVLFASRGNLRTFYGIEGSYESVLRQAIERLGVAAVAVSRKRMKGSRRVALESMAMGKSSVLATSPGHDVEIVDRAGNSEAFAAGFLAGYLENPQGLTRAVSLGAAACALAYTVPGELPCATRDEIEALAANGA